MNVIRRVSQLFVVLCVAVVAASVPSAEESPAKKPFEPVVGQSGKDVVWVPTPYILVEKMLDMVRLTPQDFVMDLGSGDGRNIIAAAKRGAHGVGVEWNQDMVEFSRRAAEKAGVADKAKFVQGDMYAADISRANVLPLFLLTENLDRLAPKFMEMRPGSRIVVNGFRISGWDHDETDKADGDCGSWCTAYLYIVPARAAGRWQIGQGELTLQQNYQKLTGTLRSSGKSMPISEGRLNGEQISFRAGNVEFSGRVDGNTMSGEMRGGASGTWTGTKK